MKIDFELLWVKLAGVVVLLTLASTPAYAQYNADRLRGKPLCSATRTTNCVPSTDAAGAYVPVVGTGSVTPAGVTGARICTISSSSATAYVGATSPAMSTYPAGVEVRFSANQTSGAAPTLNCGGGAMAIRDALASAAIPTGFMESGYVYTVRSNGTYWLMQEPAPGASGQKFLSTLSVSATVSASNLPISVMAAPYNAVCNGTTDDAAAIQAAITANPGKRIELPGGRYCAVNSGLTIASDDTEFAGQGTAVSRLICNYTGSTPCINVKSSTPGSPVNRPVVRDMYIKAGATNQPDYGVRYDFVTTGSVSRLVLDNFKVTGLDLDTIWECFVDHIKFQQIGLSGTATTAALNFGTSTHKNANNTESNVSNLVFGSNIGVQIGFNNASYGASVMSIHNFIIENDSSSDAANESYPEIYIAASGSINFSNGYIATSPKLNAKTRDIFKIDSTTASVGIVLSNITFAHGPASGSFTATGANSFINVGTNGAGTGISCFGCRFSDPGNFIADNKYIIGTRPVRLPASWFLTTKTIAQLWASNTPIRADGSIFNETGAVVDYYEANTIQPTASGFYLVGNVSGATIAATSLVANSDVNIGSTSGVMNFWGGSSNDTGVSRCAPGVLCVGTGATGSKAGKIAVSNSTPTAATDACTAQSVWADADYVYVCTASGAIKRAAIASW